MFVKFNNLLSEFRAFSQNTLYIRLMLVLLCISQTVILMQAGSMFLLDYIPSSQSAIRKINHQEIYWRSQIASIRLSDIKNARESIAALKGQRYFDTSDLDILRVLKLNNMGVEIAVTNVKKTEAKFEQAGLSLMPIAIMLERAQDVVLSYEMLSVAMHNDMEFKQDIIALLQLIGLLFVIICIVVLALEVRKVLIKRLGSLNAFISDKFFDVQPEPMADEFTRLEQKVFELTAQLEGYVAEVAWGNNTNIRLRKLIDAQEFLYKYITMMNDDLLSERNLLKMLYSLERAMNFDNVSIFYADDAAVISTEHVICSHHVPNNLSKEIFEELELTGMASYIGSNVDNIQVSYFGIAFSGSSAGIDILLVEMDKERVLEDSEIRVLETTAKLLTLITKCQNHDEEGRRIAILEERASIARELHDSLAQSLSYMKIQLSRLQTKTANDDDSKISINDLKELRGGLDNAYRELRELLTTFRAHMDVRGLGYAIQSAIDEYSQRSSLSISLDNRLTNCRLTVNEEFHVLHLVRESLSNIVRHSQANNASILMLWQSNNNLFVLTIDDDGIGFPHNAYMHGHHGQSIMQERAHSLGGSIDVMAKRNGGTRVKLVFTPKFAQ